MKKSSAASAVPQLTFVDVEAAMRGRIRETLEKLIEEEIDAALGASRHERREDRRGYRHGTKPARVVVKEHLRADTAHEQRVLRSVPKRAPAREKAQVAA